MVRLEKQCSFPSWGGGQLELLLLIRDCCGQGSWDMFVCILLILIIFYFDYFLKIYLLISEREIECMGQAEREGKRISSRLAAGGSPSQVLISKP